MNVSIKRNWAIDGYDLYVYEREPMRTLRLDSDSGPSWVEMPQGTMGEPTLRLPSGILEAILAEAEKIIPASHATERHLLREIEVSNRLLALVENVRQA